MSKTQLKITHIASGDLWAGAEAQLFTLCLQLSEIPLVEVDTILFNHGELETRLLQQGIKVTILDESLFTAVQIVKKLINHINISKPDIIHTHRSKENVLGSIAAKLTSIPSIRTVHGATENSFNWLKPQKQLPHFIDWLMGYFIQKRIIAVSSDLGIKLGRKFPKSKISTIENGVDVDAIGSPKLEFLSNTNSPLRVGFIGRLVSVKRVDIFIQTAKYWASHYPDMPAEFHIFGSGPLLETLIQLSKRLDMSDKVYFHGHCSNIHQHLMILDILLITSEHEGLPMTLLEAMTLKIPVIASAVGGIPHALSEGKCGVLISKQSVRDYAEAIHNCVVNKENTLKMIHNGRAKIEQSYTAKANALKYKTIYQEIVKKYNK